MGTSIEKVFSYRNIQSIIILLLLIAILIGLIIGKFSKKSYVIWSAATVLTLFILGKQNIDIYLDMKEKSYIIYQGTYKDVGGSREVLKTVIIYDENGEKIKLWRAGKFKKGKFVGTVIYGKRSKVVVECRGVPKN